MVVDGDFGKKTKEAIIVFQRNRGLVQDGVVGSNTWDWLLKELKCKDYGKGILKNKC
ncbi:MAG: peptidoglycan-binding domain-containing protein [Thomasclavelia sp.]